MKVLMIDYEAYIYPEGISSLEDFADFANENMGKFIPIIRINDEDSEAPYYIEEDKEKIYLNLGQVESISEADITLLPREEYEKFMDEEDITIEFDIEFEEDDYNDEPPKSKRGKGIVIPIDEFQNKDD